MVKIILLKVHGNIHKYKYSYVHKNVTLLEYLEKCFVASVVSIDMTFSDDVVRMVTVFDLNFSVLLGTRLSFLSR